MEIEGTEKTKQLYLSSKANDLSRNWFNTIENKLREEFAFIGDWAGKLHGATLRIAGILHCMENNPNEENEIQADIFLNAICIAEYFT